MLVFLLCLGSVFAVKPSQDGASLGVNTLVIVPTEKTEYLISNSTLDFHVHVYNLSGFYLGNQVNCTIHVYNSTNNHFFKGSMNYSSSTGEPYAYINFIDLKPASYSYVVQCNASNLGTINYGFYSDAFKTSFNGEPIPSSLLPMVLVSLFPLLFGLTLFWGVSKLESGSEDERELSKVLTFPLKVGFFGFLPWLLLSCFQALTIVFNKYWPYPSFLEWMSSWVEWFVWLNWTVVAIIILWALYVSLMLFRISKSKRDNYE